MYQQKKILQTWPQGDSHQRIWSILYYCGMGLLGCHCHQISGLAEWNSRNKWSFQKWEHSFFQKQLKWRNLIYGKNILLLIDFSVLWPGARDLLLMPEDVSEKYAESE